MGGGNCRCVITPTSRGPPQLGGLKLTKPDGRLDIGCAAAHDLFGCGADRCAVVTPIAKPATAFLFELIARLQVSATVPMIDIRAYARWLEVSAEPLAT